MKEVFVDLAGYHLWANQRLLAAIAALPPELPEQTVHSSFPSLKQTFLHLFWAETTWLRRLQGMEAVSPGSLAVPDFGELSQLLTGSNEKLVAWIGDQKEPYFSQTIAYYNTKMEYFNMPIYQCLLQLFNHGTYHRGQVVTIFHQLGITTIPGTDYIIFKRLKK